jgi:hypothetical protein
MRRMRSFSFARVNFQSNGAAVALYRSWKREFLTGAQARVQPPVA